MCIHQIFEQRASETPNAIAIADGEKHWTYRSLNTWANRIAKRLRGLGARPEAIVALDLERSPEMVAAILGILKAGAAYAPLDPNDPPARREALLAELNPVSVLTASALADPESGPGQNLPNLNTPGNLAYVMFTSGSTGTPKGVMVEHRSVIRLVRNASYAELNARQVHLQMAPLAFDASTFEIWGALLNGATLAIMPAGQPSLAEIGRAIQEHDVTTLWLTAGLFHAMVDQQLESLMGVKQLLAGGDVLSPTHVRRFLDTVPACRLINGYGPTENTTFTCCYTVPQDHPAGTPVPIGTPIAGTTVYIENGELYAGGEGVARGYLNHPELTAERFPDDPNSGKPGAKMYRTGDLARQREDGVIEFLGRADGQLKLRGFRVELGEVEAALSALDAVAQCAVIATGQTAEDKQLAAFIVPAAGHRPEESDLRLQLKRKLPPYMVPARFEFVGHLPLTANGKVDRRALAEGRLPEIDVEEVIRETWTEVLGIPSPDSNTSFFDLGGSSLQLLRVQGQI